MAGLFCGSRFGGLNHGTANGGLNVSPSAEANADELKTDDCANCSKFFRPNVCCITVTG
jgi:hypothetical protein